MLRCGVNRYRSKDL